MGRSHDTIGTKTGRARLAKKTPMLVTQLLASISMAYEEQRWEDFYKGIEIALSRTIPKLSSIENIIDLGPTVALLEEFKHWKELPPSNVQITTVEAKELPPPRNNEPLEPV